MMRQLLLFGVAAALLLGIVGTGPALAQKPGGILRSFTIDSPASVSIHEENTVFAERPMIPVFNNAGSPMSRT